MSQKRVYTVRFTAQSLTAASPFVFFQPKATGPGSAIEIISCRLGQHGSTTSAMERVQWYTQVTAWPTGGGTPTPTPKNFGDPASGLVGGASGAAGTIGTAFTAAGAGAKTVIGDDSFNVLTGWLYIPVPEERETIGVAGTAQGFGIWFPAGPTTLTNWTMTFTYMEII